MAKATGVVRKIDDLGRVVIPMELRRSLSIGEKEPLEIFVEGETILLRKYEPFCTFCSSNNNLSIFKGKQVCGTCAEELK